MSAPDLNAIRAQQCIDQGVERLESENAHLRGVIAEVEKLAGSDGRWFRWRDESWVKVGDIRRALGGGE